MNIELRHIHKRFGPVHANDDINVTFHQGRIVGVLGENGAGKSTLMKILAGYYAADSGDIRIDDRHVHYTGPQAAIAHRIGMLQQDPLDVWGFNALENFIYGHGTGLMYDQRQAHDTLVSLCQRFGFDIDPDMPVENMTIAQRQQLEIARLLALGVRALILDEPTTGISADQKDKLFDALRQLAHQDGMIVLLVSHKLEDVIALCDQVIVLRSGRLVGEKDMPATTRELVALMFGGELPAPSRDSVPLGQPVLALTGVHLRSKRLDMSAVSLTLRAGEVVGLAGLAGSGQSLIMRACVGLEHVLSGQVVVRDQDMTGKPYRSFLKNGVIFAPSGRLEEGLIAGLTLVEHVALTADDGRVVDWERAEQRTRDQIARYHVRGRASDTVEQLSGGNQQRTLMALMPENAAALVLEQPTRGLDVESSNWIWQQLLARRAGGTAILFSSDELEELVAYSDRILVLYAGQIHEVANAAQTSVDELGHLIGGAFIRDKHETNRG